MAKKKGPPYTDDPECVYIVIDNPWPWGKTGKERNDWYFNMIGVWVWYMLGKPPGEPTSIYSVNTRAEVIVQLSEGVDVTPILGEHRGYEFLNRWFEGPADFERVAHVFPYNYRLKGHPGKHQWKEDFAKSGEPPERFRYLNWPYPKPHWASLEGRSSRDIALPLPASRQPTPPPAPQPTPPPKDTQFPQDVFQPYEAPAHYNPGTAAGPPIVEAQEARLFVLAKMDPYEAEEAALQFVKAEPMDEGVYLKQEVKSEELDAIVKQENSELAVKQEEAPEPSREPSARFVAAFERLQEARRQASAATPHEQVKQEDPPAEPSQLSPAYLAAFERLQQRREAAAAQAQGGSTEPPSTASRSTSVLAMASENGHEMQPEQETPPAPSASIVRVKLEPTEDVAFPGPAAYGESRPSNGVNQRVAEPRRLVKTEPVEGILHRPFNGLGQNADPRMAASKRMKTEEDDEPMKRVKVEGR